MLGKRGGMSRSLALAVDLAYSLEINDERTWPSCMIREREYRRILWWTLVYMDCRVALNTQRPLLLRHTGFHVGDFTDISFGQYMQDVEFDSCQITSGLEALRLPWPLPAKPPGNYCDWLLFNMRWCKVVARVWDSKSSPMSIQRTAESIETVDTSLASIQRTLPPSLKWNAGYLPSSIKAGDIDRACRFKIIVFEVRAHPQHKHRSIQKLTSSKATNVLRLSIRSSWLYHSSNIDHISDYEDAARFTETLTASLMNAIVTYLTLRNYARPWSTYASGLLVQLSSRVAPILRSRNALSETSFSLIASMSNAQACMQELASINLFAAKNASINLARMLEGLQLPYSGTISRLCCAPEVDLLEDGADSRISPIEGRSDIRHGASDAFWENLFSLT